MISEVVRIEEESYQIKALSQRQQGRWTTWEGVISRTVGWADMWKIPQARLSFLIRSTYDTLPSPSNLCLWYGSEESCQLCNAPNPSLQHILSSCKTALHRPALEELRRQIRSSTTSMTSVPKPLKFLRPQYGKLKEIYDGMAPGENKVRI